MFHDFLFGKHVKGTVLLHALELVEAVHTRAHGLEIGHHTAEPTGVDVILTAPGRFFTNGVLRLLFRAHEEQGLTALGQFAHEIVGLLQFADGLLKVDDINTVALRVDIRGHFGVPSAGLVPEVDARLEQGLHGNNAGTCHGFDSS